MLGQAAGVVVAKPRAEQNLAVKTEQREQKWEYDGDTTRWLCVMLLFCEPLQLDTTASSDCAVQATDPSTYLWTEIDKEMRKEISFAFSSLYDSQKRQKL